MNNKKNTISYENIKPSLILFNNKKESEEGNDIFTYSSIISTSINNKEEGEMLLNLNKIYLQDNTYIDIKEYGHEDGTRRNNTSKVMNTYFESGNGRYCQKMDDDSYRVLSKEEFETFNGLKIDFNGSF